MSEFFVQLYSILVSVVFVYAGLYIFFSIGELCIPAERGHSISGRLRNLAITVVYVGLGYAALLMVRTAIPAGAVLPTQTALLSNVLLILVFIAVLDFFYYWYHRAQHTFAWFWPIHETHHADTELNVTSSYRTYWLELPLQAVFVALPASLVVGDVFGLLAVTSLVLLAWEFFTHANMRIHLGPLSPVVCGPQVHRIHHSIESKHYNKNFAQYFPLWDVLFGTYYHPARDEFPATGVRSLPVDAPLYEATLFNPVRKWLKRTRSR